MRKSNYIGIFFLLVMFGLSIMPQYVHAAACTQADHQYKTRIISHADGDNDGECEFYCIYCGDTYTKTIPRTGHHYGEFQVETQATCAIQGLKYRECQDCEKREYEVIPFSNEHNFGEWKVVKQSGCSETGIRQRICKDCNQSQEEEIASAKTHDYEEITYPATCTEDGEIIKKCKNCGDTKKTEILAAIGHNYGEEIVKQEATEDREGIVWRICANDESHILERALPKLAKAETEQPEAFSEPEQPVPPKEEKRAVNVIEAAVVGANTATFGIFFFLIKSDLGVLKWIKRNRRLMYEQGGKSEK